MLLRQVATTIAAALMGVLNVALRRRESLPELKPGDKAPDFALMGSDGRTYRLKDLAGQPVALAWVSKAFTGGWTGGGPAPRAGGRAMPKRRLCVFFPGVR